MIDKVGQNIIVNMIDKVGQTIIVFKLFDVEMNKRERYIFSIYIIYLVSN